MSSPTRSKSDALVSLMAFIYGPERKKLEVQLERILERHRLITQDNAFKYKGQYYIATGAVGSRAALLAPELQSNMDSWLKEKEALEDEEKRSISVLSCVISQARNKAHLMQLLPDSLKSSVAQVDDSAWPSPMGMAPVPEAAFGEIKKRILLNLIC